MNGDVVVRAMDEWMDGWLAELKERDWMRIRIRLARAGTELCEHKSNVLYCME